MKIFNVWKNNEPSLEAHEDERGKIADIFYDTTINHVAIISSKAGAIRGNHYHKLTTQYVLVTKGEVEYWHKPIETEEPTEHKVLKEGDFVVTPPLCVHAFKTLSDNEFIVFSTGLRGGKDYEKDTYRLDSPLLE